MTLIEQLDNTSVHFVIGAGRSGTTILTMILNAHPEVSCTPEVKQVMTFYKDYAHQNPVSEQYITDFEKYQKTRYKKMKGIFWGFDMDKYLNDLRNLNGKLSYAQAAKLFLLGVKTEQKNEEVKWVINKNPDFTFCVKELLEIYPDAKFLVSMRDYRAVYLSQKESKDKNNFSQFMGNSCSAVAYFWELHNREVQHCMQQYPNKLMLVPYERIVTDKENLTHEVCAFLDIPFLPQMLTHEQQTEAKSTETAALTDERKLKRKNDLVKPVFTDRLEAWKTRLTPKEIATCEAICGNMGSQFGYEPSLQISPIKRFWLYLSNAPQLIITYFSYLVFMRWYYFLPFSWRLFMVKYLNIKR
ncbi:MAG: sulfotransferase [Chitinophagales bacterium]|nr:sulfotransferase [Chitinophagales bacterium]